MKQERFAQKRVDDGVDDGPKTPSIVNRFVNRDP